MTLNEYKDYLSLTIEVHLQSDNAYTLNVRNLQTLQTALRNQDTLSDLLFLLFHEADLLHEQIGSGWIEELQHLAKPEQLLQQRILINPTEIKSLDSEKRHLALFTRPQETTQHMGEVLYIGTREINLQGGHALVQGQSHVQARGESQVTAIEQATVVAMDYAAVNLYGSSCCKAYDEARINAHSQSSVIAMGSNMARLTDQARGVTFTGNQMWELCDHSQLLIPASYKSNKKLQVKMDGQSHLFNCANKVSLGIRQAYGHSKSVVPCKSAVVQEALLTSFMTSAEVIHYPDTLLEPLPIEVSKERLRAELPKDVTPEEKARFEEATSEMELCAAVELIMRQHPGHGITAQTLASTITNGTLGVNHINVFGNYPVKPQQGCHYHFFGQGVFCPDYGDQNTYHMNGHSVAISYYNTPIIASQEALLLQVGDNRTNRLYGQSKGFLFSKGTLSAHDQSQVYAGGCSTVYGHDHVHVESDEQVKVHLDGHATGICGGETKVSAKGESRVVGDDQARIDLYNQSQGGVLKSSTATVIIHSEEATGALIENEGSIASFLYAMPTNEKKQYICR